MLPAFILKKIAPIIAQKALGADDAKDKADGIAFGDSPMPEEQEEEVGEEEGGQEKKEPRKVRPIRAAGIHSFIELGDEALKFWYAAMTRIYGYEGQNGTAKIQPDGTLALPRDDSEATATKSGQSQSVSGAIDGDDAERDEDSGFIGIISIFALPLILGVVARWGIRIVNKDGKDSLEATNWKGALNEITQEGTNMDHQDVEYAGAIPSAATGGGGGTLLERSGLGGFRISSKYAESRDFGSGSHKAIDVSAPIGTPIKAPFDGYINYVDNVDDSTAGKYVEIATEDGLHIIRYLHLSEPLVKAGDRVQMGQTIARSGNTFGGKKRPDGSPWSSGPHVHIEYRKAKKKIAVGQGAYGLELANPLSFVEQSGFDVVSGKGDVRVTFSASTKIGTEGKNLMSIMNSGSDPWLGTINYNKNKAGTFAAFSSYAYGFRAGMINLQKYQTKYDVSNSGGEYITIADIAQNSKNHSYVSTANGDDIGRWVSTVSQASGIAPTEQIDLRRASDLARVTRGIAMAEHSARVNYEDLVSVIHHFNITDDLVSNQQQK